ncbi:MAG: hypothetical protein ABIE55_03815 [Candidatus Aenigmatarchaeota archaeon]
MTADPILGQTKSYRHKDMPDAVRRAAESLPKLEGNPHLPVYGSQHLEILRKSLEKQLNVSIPHILVKIIPEEKPSIDYETDLVFHAGYSGTEG